MNFFCNSKKPWRGRATTQNNDSPWRVAGRCRAPCRGRTEPSWWPAPDQSPRLKHSQLVSQQSHRATTTTTTTMTTTTTHRFHSGSPLRTSGQPWRGRQEVGGVKCQLRSYLLTSDGIWFLIWNLHFKHINREIKTKPTKQNITDND